MGIALNAPSPLLVEQVEWRLSAHSKHQTKGPNVPAGSGKSANRTPLFRFPKPSQPKEDKKQSPISREEIQDREWSPPRSLRKVDSDQAPIKTFGRLLTERLSQLRNELSDHEEGDVAAPPPPRSPPHPRSNTPSMSQVDWELGDGNEEPCNPDMPDQLTEKINGPCWPSPTLCASPERHSHHIDCPPVHPRLQLDSTPDHSLEPTGSLHINQTQAPITTPLLEVKLEVEQTGPPSTGTQVPIHIQSNETKRILINLVDVSSEEVRKQRNQKKKSKKARERERKRNSAVRAREQKRKDKTEKKDANEEGEEDEKGKGRVKTWSLPSTTKEERREKARRAPAPNPSWLPWQSPPGKHTPQIETPEQEKQAPSPIPDLVTPAVSAAPLSAPTASNPEPQSRGEQIFGARSQAKTTLSKATTQAGPPSTSGPYEVSPTSPPQPLKRTASYGFYSSHSASSTYPNTRRLRAESVALRRNPDEFKFIPILQPTSAAPSIRHPLSSSRPFLIPLFSSGRPSQFQHPNVPDQHLIQAPNPIKRKLPFDVLSDHELPPASTFKRIRRDPSPPIVLPRLKTAPNLTQLRISPRQEQVEPADEGPVDALIVEPQEPPEHLE